MDARYVCCTHKMESATQKLIMLGKFDNESPSCWGTILWTMGGKMSRNERSRHETIRALTRACFGAGVNNKRMNKNMLQSCETSQYEAMTARNGEHTSSTITADVKASILCVDIVGRSGQCRRVWARRHAGVSCHGHGWEAGVYPMMRAQLRIDLASKPTSIGCTREQCGCLMRYLSGAKAGR